MTAVQFLRHCHYPRMAAHVVYVLRYVWVATRWALHRRINVMHVRDGKAWWAPRAPAPLGITGTIGSALTTSCPSRDMCEYRECLWFLDLSVPACDIYVGIHCSSAYHNYERVLHCLVYCCRQMHQCPYCVRWHVITFWCCLRDPDTTDGYDWFVLFDRFVLLESTLLADCRRCTTWPLFQRGIRLAGSHCHCILLFIRAPTCLLPMIFNIAPHPAVIHKDEQPQTHCCQTIQVANSTTRNPSCVIAKAPNVHVPTKPTIISIAAVICFANVYSESITLESPIIPYDASLRTRCPSQSVSPCRSLPGGSARLSVPGPGRGLRTTAAVAERALCWYAWMPRWTWRRWGWRVRQRCRRMLPNWPWSLQSNSWEEKYKQMKNVSHKIYVTRNTNFNIGEIEMDLKSRYISHGVRIWFI